MRIMTPTEMHVDDMRRRRSRHPLTARYLLWSILPGIGAGAVAAAFAEKVVKQVNAASDWGTISVICTATMGSGLIVGATGLILWKRSLLRYLTKRKGRMRALRQFLPRREIHPAQPLHLRLMIYGVTEQDMTLLRARLVHGRMVRK